MGKQYHIVMADVLNSSNLENPKLLSKQLQMIVSNVNKKFEKEILSPLTITLGDEFQGVIKNLNSSIYIIIYIEEMIIELGLLFKLRYVYNFGIIDTVINREISYGMLGKGLADTRKYLNSIKKNKKRVFFLEGNKQLDNYRNLFFVLMSFIDAWHKDDAKIINAFLELQDYKLVSKKLKIEDSRMWKKKRTLHMDEYFALKNTILNLC